MRIFLTGGTGFIGTRLIGALRERGDECVVVSRGRAEPLAAVGVKVVTADPTDTGAWQEEVARSDAVVNLAGAKIVDPPHRWTASRKAELRDSRIETTRRVVEAIGAAATAPAVLVSASAIGYYGGRGDDVLDETEPAGSDFLARLAVDWEAAALAATTRTRVTVLRGGLALGADGGVLASLIPIFKLGLGGPWGDGSEWWSWIHAHDQVRLVLYVLDGSLAGPVNATAPQPVTVREFVRALGHALGRPAIARVPEFAVRAALGEAADALLRLQRVVPTKALEAGFAFRYEAVNDALRAIFDADTG
jgi:uncharacterized protein (TIGR01777 family)